MNLPILILLYVYCAFIVLADSIIRDRGKYHWSVNWLVSLVFAVFWLPILVVSFSCKTYKTVRWVRRLLRGCPWCYKRVGEGTTNQQAAHGGGIGEGR